MKKIFLLIVVIAVGLSVCAQKPPQKVVDNFSRKFKNAPKVRWTKDGENEWEAEFKKDGKEMLASYDNEGKWVSTGVKISKKDLPEYTRRTVTGIYRGWEIEDVASYKSRKFKGYELRLEKGVEEMEILINENGKIKVKKEPKYM